MDPSYNHTCMEAWRPGMQTAKFTPTRCEVGGRLTDALGCATPGTVIMRPSAKGMFNQVLFVNGFLSAAASSRLHVALPTFILQPYDRGRNQTFYIVPFYVLFDLAEFVQTAAIHGLSLSMPQDFNQPVLAAARPPCHVHAQLAPPPGYHNTCPLKRSQLAIQSFATCDVLNPYWQHRLRSNRTVHWMQYGNSGVYNHSLSPYGSLHVSSGPFFSGISYSNHVRAVTRGVVDHMRSQGGFIGVHFRVEISVGVEHAAKVRTNHSFGDVEANVRETRRAIHDRKHALKAAGVRYLYVASYLPASAPAIVQLAEAVRPILGNVQVVTKFSFFDSAAVLRMKHLTREMLGLVEASILEDADLFVGHCGSTMSHAVWERRMVRVGLNNSELIFASSEGGLLYCRPRRFD